jgi:polynucleotide 5'-kinase involved in rRNA processing
MNARNERAYERLLAGPGVVVLVGGLDTGKTTFALELARRAVDGGLSTAIVDADIVQSTVGPPTTVGLKFLGPGSVVSPEGIAVADRLAFVGSLVPKGHLLALIAGAVKLVDQAREVESELIIVDTTSLVSGLYGQALKYFKLDLVRPDFVVAFERGGELEPVVGLAQRFTPAEVIELEVSPDARARTVEERIAQRERQFASYFSGGTSRWRVKPTVFMPTLPPEFDLALLDAIVVGMENGKGDCVGIGVLEFEPGEGILRMVSPVAEGVRGLRLGSIRMEVGGRSRGPVDLRQLFGSE